MNRKTMFAAGRRIGGEPMLAWAVCPTCKGGKKRYNFSEWQWEACYTCSGVGLLEIG